MSTTAAATSHSYIRYPGDGEIFQFAGVTITVKSTEAEMATGGSVCELQLPSHFGRVMAHTHQETTEWFYVLQGTAAFTLNNETIVARAGTYIFVPAGVTHTFWNPTASAVTLLVFRSHTDTKQYLSTLRALVAATEPVDESTCDSNQQISANGAALLSLSAAYDLFLTDAALATVLSGGGCII